MCINPSILLSINLLLVSIHIPQESDVVTQTLHHISIQRILLHLNRLGSGGCPGAELGDHGVIEGGDDPPFVDTSVDAQDTLVTGEGAGLLVGDQGADGGQEVATRFLGVHSGQELGEGG